MDELDIDIFQQNSLKPPLQNVKRFTLSNGQVLLVKEDHTIPLVAIFVWVKVGSLNEPDNLAGISHFIEHMLFKGTKKRAVGDLAREEECRSSTDARSGGPDHRQPIPDLHNPHLPS